MHDQIDQLKNQLTDLERRHREFVEATEQRFADLSHRLEERVGFIDDRVGEIRRELAE